MTWTAEQVAELGVLWIQQEPFLSAADIGSVMGMTKNKVVGKARRLGLPFRRKPRTDTESVRSREMLRLMRAASKKIRVRVKLPPTEVPKMESVPGGLHIMDLKDGHCRAIVGRGADGLARYCGASVGQRKTRSRGVVVLGADGKPIMRDIVWCDTHADIYLNE